MPKNLWSLLPGDPDSYPLPPKPRKNQVFNWWNSPSARPVAAKVAEERFVGPRAKFNWLELLKRKKEQLDLEKLMRSYYLWKMVSDGETGHTENAWMKIFTRAKEESDIPRNKKVMDKLQWLFEKE